MISLNNYTTVHLPW